jgi:hypothetical protein
MELSALFAKPWMGSMLSYRHLSVVESTYAITSIVLFALVSANYNFLFMDVGYQGRILDGGVFRSYEL